MVTPKLELLNANERSVADNIREFLNRDPFAPFRLVMSSGHAYDVVSPQSAALLKSEVFVVFPDGERWSHLPFLHIAHIESVSNGRGRNGHPRRKRKS